jgi:hypothetical protein
MTNDVDAPRIRGNASARAIDETEWLQGVTAMRRIRHEVQNVEFIETTRTWPRYSKSTCQANHSTTRTRHGAGRMIWEYPNTRQLLGEEGDYESCLVYIAFCQLI